MENKNKFKLDKVDALAEHEAFIRDLVALYKQKEVLWQPKHPHYRNKSARAEGYQALLRKTQEYYPDADEDFVRMKLESMRTSFRKERKKVLRSKEASDNPDEIYKPSLWYYDLLLFTVGEEAEEVINPDIQHEEASVQPENGTSVKTPFWTREQTAILINLYKNQPILYSSSHPCYRSKGRRNDAVKKITNKLMSTTGKFFHAEDVRRKISLVRGQFLYEYKKIKKIESKGEEYKPSLWCFEMLNFLTGEYTSPKKTPMQKTNEHSRRKQQHRTSSSEDSDVDIKKESDSSMSSENGANTIEDEDILDTISKNLVHQLKGMTEEQREIANRIIREVMYHGQMEHLTEKSRFSLDGK